MYYYIHIPFCKIKCKYCSFYSVPFATKNMDSTENSLVDDYISAVLAEARWQQECFPAKERKTIYIGGGTPSLLSIVQLKRLIKGLTTVFPCAQNCEFTIEINPQDFSSDLSKATEYFETCIELGINRFSLGVQCIDSHVLHVAGRNARADDIRVVLKLFYALRLKHGISFSLDLITGLPAMNMEIFTNSLKEALSYVPDHLSLYSLMIEKGTPFYRDFLKGRLDYDEDFSDEQWLLGRDFLVSQGYEWYEISNFALSGKKSVHNSAYWQMQDYFGLGVAAVGTVGNKRYRTISDVQQYVNYWNKQPRFSRVLPNTIQEIEQLSKSDRMYEFLMMGFRTSEGVNSKEFFLRFQQSLDTVVGEAFTKRIKNGQAEILGDFYRLKGDGLLFLNSFLTEI